MKSFDTSMKVGSTSERGGGSRREFLTRCATLLRGVTIVGVLAPIATSCDTTLEPRDPDSGGNGGGSGGNTATFDVSGLADGQGVLTLQKGPDGYSIMIVRESDGRFYALSTRCTHQGCDVNLPQSGSINCPCHGSRFNLDGTVVQGPAASPLTDYELTHDATASTVTITLS